MSVREKLLFLVFFTAGLACLPGCARLIDGWPTPISREDYCRIAEEKKNAPPAPDPKQSAQAPAPAQNSIHRPYEDKHCEGCHDEDKKSLSGLIKPKDELCFTCHPKIIQHAWAHGPTAQGECLACHQPHEASNPFLLSSDRANLCRKCHTEQRLTPAMHQLVISKGLACLDCHDPHSGDSHKLLR